MPIRLAVRSSDTGHWYVTAEDTYLIGFSGPHARELALQQQRELAALLNAECAPYPLPDGEPGAAVPDDQVNVTSLPRSSTGKA